MIAEQAQSPSCVDARLLTQNLRVASVSEGVATLDNPRRSACEKCGARAGCGAGALAEMFPATSPRLPVPPGASIAAGDFVTVTMPGQRFLALASLAYLLPPLTLVLGAGLCVALGLPDLVTAVLCVPLLALSLIPLAYADRVKPGLQISKMGEGE